MKSSKFQIFLAALLFCLAVLCVVLRGASAAPELPGYCWLLICAAILLLARFSAKGTRLRSLQLYSVSLSVVVLFLSLPLPPAALFFVPFFLVLALLGGIFVAIKLHLRRCRRFADTLTAAAQTFERTQDLDAYFAALDRSIPVSRLPLTVNTPAGKLPVAQYIVFLKASALRSLDREPEALALLEAEQSPVLQALFSQPPESASHE